MENHSDFNNFLEIMKEKFALINEERNQNVQSQIQNFLNNFEKTEKLPTNQNILTNFNYIQYQKFSMRRLNFDNDNFTEQMMMLKNSNSPENNIFTLKENGYSYKANCSLLEENVKNNEMNNVVINNNLKNNAAVEKLNNCKDIINNKIDTNSINNNNNKTLNNNHHQYKPIFLINNKTIRSVSFNKKGRIALNTNKKIHTALDDDNILRKVQVHFLSFIINFINDIIKTFLPYSHKELLFKNIDYQIKKVVNHESIEKIKSNKILDILQFDISPKNRLYEKTTNSKIAEKICIKLPFMDEFFRQDYLDFFNDYYYSKLDKNFIINDKAIKLTNRTKIFSELLKKNSSYKENIKNVVRKYLLCGYNKMRRPNFEIIKIDNDV